MEPIDISISTPKELAEYLLTNRFKNDAPKTLSFLLQTMDHLPNMEEISAQLMEQNEQNLDEEESNEQPSRIGEAMNLPLPMDDGDALVISVSATAPRTKFNLAIHENGLRLVTPKQEEIIIHASEVKQIVIFPKREDCLKAPKLAKDGSHILIPGSQALFILEKDKIQFRKKPLSQICLLLPQHKSQSIAEITCDDDAPYPSEKQLRDACIDSFTENIVQLLQSSLNLKNGIYRIYNPKFCNMKKISSYTFKSDDGGTNSSITQANMPFVKCYNGVNDGVLFPMEEGLLFFKPPLFVHRSELHSISCGRGGGSRYVDLHAVLDSKDDSKINLEFTNIDREEVKVLNDYIQNTLVKAMARDVADDKEDANHSDQESDMNIDTEDSEEQPSSRKRKVRQAAIESRKATKYRLASTAKNSSKSEIGNSDDDGSDDDDDDDFCAVVESEEDDGDDDRSDTDSSEISLTKDEVEDITTASQSSSPSDKTPTRAASTKAKKTIRVELEVSSESDGDDGDYKSEAETEEDDVSRADQSCGSGTESEFDE